MFTPYKYVIPHVVCLDAVHDCAMQRSSVECTLGIVDLATTGNLRRLQLLHLRLNPFARHVYSDTNFPP